MVLEKINLKKTMMKEEYKPEVEPLRERLETLQQSIKENKLPVMVLFDGWGAAGKGGFISSLIQNLDPRNFNVYTNGPMTEEESRKPLLWRYWNQTPAQGRVAILDTSWYQEISAGRVEEDLSPEAVDARVESINTFERQLTDDGTLIIKLFLHIDQKEQKSRLDKLAASPLTSWRVSDRDRKRNKNYDRYYKAFDEMLQRTDKPWAPWHIVGAHNQNSAMAQIYRVVVEAIQEALDKKQQPAPPPEEGPIPAQRFNLVEIPKLEDIRLNKTVEDDKYKELLKRDQKKLAELHNRIYLNKVPVVIVYEGWDAAGKGGNIKRLTAALDPRGYEAIPIAAPDREELAHHYLWRFWRHIPKTGHIAIFDRSWYGRVMVERIEGFCAPDQWRRAYNEINEFEKELSDWGAVVVKFWLHVDQDEQLRRFTDRQNTPEKLWKITDEDWRNREKWDQYEVAVSDMLHNTSTDYAPWTVVESNDKKFARLKALSTLISAIENKL